MSSFLLQMSIVRKQIRSSMHFRKLHCGLRAHHTTMSKALPWEDPAIERVGWNRETKWPKRKHYGLKTIPIPCQNYILL